MLIKCTKCKKRFQAQKYSNGDYPLLCPQCVKQHESEPNETDVYNIMTKKSFISKRLSNGFSMVDH